MQLCLCVCVSVWASGSLSFPVLNLASGSVSDELIGAGFPRDWAVNIRRDLDTVVKEKRHMIKHIVEGLFDFNPRF